MRNLKKILALVLALVMSLSLMATAGASSFPDVDAENPYATAIDVLDGLKVFQGYKEDGTFRPTETLNRAQAAVLVYRIATGDVEDKYVENYTYMAQSKFNDLDGYTWAKGYINYCQNAKIVVGTSDTTFAPGAKVTGYQLMVMLLRTLGYGAAGEFTDPTKWELETAKIAEREGLLKNVTGGDFGAPAQRQMVAEILFRGLLHDTMQYSPLTPNGYTPSGEILGKRVGLSEVEGVVLANEYASLNDTDVLAEGKTQLDDNLIDYTTDFDDIGERKLVYLKDGKTVLSIADSSKNTREFTLDESSLKDLLKKANLSAGDADHFINFAEVDKYTTPYRIRYVLKYDDANEILGSSDADKDDVVATAEALHGEANVSDDTAKKEISVTLKPKSEVYKFDRDWMEYIFADGDLEAAKDEDNDPTTVYEVGEIYVNTQSTKDISDDPDYYYEKFEETFLTYDDNKTIIDGNEKGNWLKVIDNDADGKADYVLKVIYTGAQVERIKNDKIALDVKNHALVDHDRLADGVSDDEVNTLTTQTVVNMSDEDLAEGDVVYYAIIDGVARAYKAEMVTATIDKINRNTKSTTTDDGDEYFESAVCNHILDPEYMDEVTDLVGKVSFDLFFDRGGYLLTFIKSNRSGDFKLVTDGWFNSTKTADEYAARVYNDDEGKQEIVDLPSGGSKFISRDVWNYNGIQVDNNDWGALKYLGGADEDTNGGALDAFITNADPYKVAALNGGVVTDPADDDTWENRIKTTVASIDEEGNILPVDDYRITGRYDHLMIALGNDKIPTSAYSSGTPYVTDGDTAYDVNPVDEDGDAITTVELRALNTTKYYVVWPTGTESVGVKAFTGYASAGDIVKLASNRGSKGLELVEDIYAVGTKTVKENDHRDEDVYYTADIVVVELKKAPTSARDIILLVDDEGQVSSTGLRHVQVIEPDGSSKWIDVKNDPNLTLARSYEKKIQPGLYFREEAGDEVYALEWMDADDILAADCFITGQVQTVVKTGKQDYVIVNPADTETIQDKDGDKVIVDEANENTVQPIITEGAKFYTLGYGGATTAYYKQHAASLSDEDVEDYRTVLDSKVEGVEKGSAGDPALNRDFYLERDKTSYFYNDVLIRYNSDNEIVWAVSFQNTFDSKGTADYAQQVWKNVVPEVESTTVDPDPSYLYNVIVNRVDTTGKKVAEPVKFGTNTPGGSVTFTVDDLAVPGYEITTPNTDVVNEVGTAVAPTTGTTWVVTGLTADRTWTATYAAVQPDLTVAVTAGTHLTANTDVDYLDPNDGTWKDYTTTVAHPYNGTYKLRVAADDLCTYSATLTDAADGTVVGPTEETIGGTRYITFTGKILDDTTITIKETAKDTSAIAITVPQYVTMNLVGNDKDGTALGSVTNNTATKNVFTKTAVQFRLDTSALAAQNLVLDKVTYYTTTAGSSTAVDVPEVNGLYTIPADDVTVLGVTVTVTTKAAPSTAPVTVSFTNKVGSSVIMNTTAIDAADADCSAVPASVDVEPTTGKVFLRSTNGPAVVYSNVSSVKINTTDNVNFEITNVTEATAITIVGAPKTVSKSAAITSVNTDVPGMGDIINTVATIEDMEVTGTNKVTLKLSVDFKGQAWTAANSTSTTFNGFGDGDFDDMVANCFTYNPDGFPQSASTVGFYTFQVWNPTKNGTGAWDDVVIAAAPGSVPKPVVMGTGPSAVTYTIDVDVTF